MDISTLARLPASGPPDLLFLLFHGADDNASAMAGLAQRLGAEYPQSAVLCVDAPINSHLGSAGHALPTFIALVRQLQSRFGVGWERTALFGFAQGATAALEAVQLEGNLAGRVLAFSGCHAAVPQHAPHDTTVHFFHGLEDRSVPYEPSVLSARRLLALGGDVTADVLPGIGHELHPDLISKAIEQLRTFLPKKVWREAAAEAPLISRVASSQELGPD